MVASLTLAHPTGTDSANGLKQAIDDTLTGTLTNGSELASFLKVEYDTNGDGIADGSTMTDAKGNFAVAPTGLSPGTVSIRVRGVMQDPQTGNDIDGPWVTIAFELQADTNGQAPTPQSVTQNLVSADEIAATSQLVAVQAIDDALSAFNTAAGAQSTPAGQIALGMGTYTALSGDTGGRVASGSIFGFENGSLPAPAQSGGSGGGSGGGQGLSGSSPLGVPAGTPIAIPTTFSTPQTGGFTITDEAVSGSGSLGPGTSNRSGTLSVSVTTTAGSGGGGGTVTNWTIDIDITYSYTDGLSGSFNDGAGGNFSYLGTVSGGYEYHYHAKGSTTTTAGGGTIVVGTFTVDESNSYGYSWADTAIETGDGATDTLTDNSNGSRLFSHHEQGKFSSGGGTNGGLAVISSDFINKSIDSSTFTDGESDSFNTSSASGSDIGSVAHVDSTSYNHDYFDMGNYHSSWGTVTTANGSSDVNDWSIAAGFGDHQGGAASSADGMVDNFTSAAASGQVNGGSVSGDTSAMWFDNFQTGQYSSSPDNYTLNVALFHYQEQGSDGSSDKQQGNSSGNFGGVASTAAFSYQSTCADSYTYDTAGSALLTGNNTTIHGNSVGYIGLGSDSVSIQDSGGYSGTLGVPNNVPAPGGGLPGGGTTNAAPPVTVAGSSSDSESETDASFEKISGSYEIDNGVATDLGLTSTNQVSNTSFTSGGINSTQQGNSGGNGSTPQFPNGGLGNIWTQSGSESATFTSAGSYANSPTSNIAGGSYSFMDGASDSAYQSTTSHYNFSTGSTDGDQRASSSTDFAYQDSGTYSVSNGDTSITGDFASQTITLGSERDIEDDTENFGTSSSNDWSSQTATASTSYAESGTHSGTDASGTFSSSQSESSSYSYDDSHTIVQGTSGTAGYQNDSGDALGNGWQKADMSKWGNFTSGSTDSRSTSFRGTETTSDSATASSTITYTNTSQNGVSKPSQLSMRSSSMVENGDDLQGATSSNTTSFTLTTNHFSSYTSSDDGAFIGSFGGTYSGAASGIGSGMETETGVRVTDNFGMTTATGGFTDSEIDEGTNRGSLTQSPATGPSSTAIQATDNDHYTSYTDSGCFTVAGGGGETRTGNFSRTTRQNTSDDATLSGAVTSGSGTYNSEAHSTSKLTASTSGTFTSANFTVTESGGTTTDETDTANGKQTSEYTVSVANWLSHSQSSSYNSSDHITSNGSYSQSNGYIISEDIHYTEDRGNKQNGETHDTTMGNPTFDKIDNSGSSSSSVHKDGHRRKTSAGTATDDGTYRLTRTGGDNGSESKTINFNNAYGNGERFETTSGGMSGVYVELGSYSVTNGVSTSSGFYGSVTSSKSGEDDLEYASAPGNPSITWTSHFVANQSTTDVRLGSKNVSQGAVTSGWEGFTTVTNSSVTRTFDESSDRWLPDVTGAVWDDWDQVPWYMENEKVDESTARVGGPGSGSGLVIPQPPGRLQVSATASTSDTTTSSSTVTGTTTITNGVPATNSSFSTTTKFNDYAYLASKSPPDFDPGQPSARGALQTGSATFSQTNTETGTNTGGVITANFSKVGSETATLSFFTTTNSSASGDQPVYSLMQSRSMTSSTNETGSYTTSAPGAPLVPTTLDNPGGYAKFKETPKDNNSISNSESLSWAATGTSGIGGSETVHQSYAATANSKLNSTKVIEVDAAANSDTQSGDYTVTGDKHEVSKLTRKGTNGNAAVGVSWDFSETFTNDRSLDDTGTYPAGGKSKQTVSWGRTGNETDTFWGNSAGNAWSFTPSPSAWSTGGKTETEGPDGVALMQNPADSPDGSPNEAKNGALAGLPAAVWDWIRNTAYEMTPTRIGERIYAAAEVLQQDQAAIAQARMDAQAALVYEMIDPNSAMTVREFQAANARIIGQHAQQIMQDTMTVIDGAMAIGDAMALGQIGIGLGRAGLSLVSGAAKSSFLQCTLLKKACFAAGTPVRTPEGARAVESLSKGYRIFHRREADPNAPVEIGVVDEVFVLTAQIWELHIGGKVIETTAEHPFFLVGEKREDARGWTPLCRLKPGDLLLGEGKWPMTVERIVQTDRTATVYNVRVEPGHTFFVGNDDWGFSLWVHNTTCHTIGFAPSFGTGAQGEQFFSALFTGGEAHVPFTTGVGKGGTRTRYIDWLSDGIAHEVKVGAKDLTGSIPKQIEKDAWLLANGYVDQVQWHFFRNGTTGTLGPTARLLDALERNGILVFLYD